VPQFLGLGFDDNAYSGLDGSAGTGGMSWATSMLASRGIHATFYLSTIYMDVWESESPTFVKRAWHTAMTDGNEIGDHTRDHEHGAAFDQATWHTQQQDCIDSLVKPFDPAEVNFSPDPSKGIGASESDIVGFRTPFLEYDDATFAAELQTGLHYDCSIEDGYEDDEDGSNYMWPYTLDHGSPGNDVLVDWGSQQPLTPHPGLWELPVHPFVVPPDDKCAEYGVTPGFRDRLHALQDWFDPASGKITGFDYNLWVQFNMTKAEVVATLEYTLDLRIGGNRAPMMIGVHSDIYSSKYTAATASTAEERQQAIEEFVDYALSKPMVRVVPNKEILEWVRNPQPL
jgi:hypothetical protein